MPLPLLKGIPTPPSQDRLTLLFPTMQKFPEAIRRDGKGDSSRDLHGIHSDHLPILQGYSQLFPSPDTY